MKIGYPCINRTVPCLGNRTFRLKSYSENRLSTTIQNNLACLQAILKFNLTHGILFFRVTSDLIPFASHPICTYPWQTTFKDTFREIGDFISTHDIRISMHPDQFTLLNSRDPEIFDRSIKELMYHTEIMDLMRLDTTHKIQIHVGGVYGDRTQSIQRFVQRYLTLDEQITRRLVIENDDRYYTLYDCGHIHEETGVPILCDVFHHSLNNKGESLQNALDFATMTWKRQHGVPMVDYSSQQPGERQGKHAETLNPHHFHTFIQESHPYDCDVMLEIKDKEISAQKALRIAAPDHRLISTKGKKT